MPIKGEVLLFFSFEEEQKKCEAFFSPLRNSVIGGLETKHCLFFLPFKLFLPWARLKEIQPVFFLFFFNWQKKKKKRKQTCGREDDVSDVAFEWKASSKLQYYTSRVSIFLVTFVA